MEEKTDNTEYDGCPCGTFGLCCKGPDTFTPEHECEDEEGYVCEDCYVLECRNCGETCRHEA